MLRLPHFLDTWLTDGGKVVSLTRRPPITPPGRFLVLISVRGWVNPKAIVRLEGLSKLKKIQWPHWEFYRWFWNKFIFKHLWSILTNNSICGVRVAQSVYWQATSWTIGVWFLVGARDFSLLYSVQTSSEAHRASYPVGTGGLSMGVKWSGREADHSPPSEASVKNDGAIPPLRSMSSWHDV
jgi:hypothetical protein